MTPECVTVADTLAAIWRLGTGSEPVTASEVADELDITRRTAYNKLEQLAERGDIRSKKVGAHSRVWWIDTAPPAQQQPPPDREQASPRVEAITRITNGFYALDPEFRFTYLNDSAKALLDLDASALGADIHEELFLTDTFKTHLHDAVKSGDPAFFEEYYKPFDAWFVNAIYPSDTGVSVYFRENFERKERERDLERVERQFEATFNNPSAFMGLLDPDGTVRRINDTALEFIGVEEDAVRGESFWETPWFPDDPDARAEVRRKLDRVASGEYVRAEFTHEAPDGEIAVIDSRLEPVYDDAGDVVGILASGTDITERKHRERDFAESERRFRALVENFPNGTVTLVDQDLTYRTVGGDPQELADVRADEIEDCPVSEAIPPPLADELVPRYEAALAGEASVFEAEYDDRIFEFHVVPIRDDAGDVVAALGMSQHITEREAYRRQLEESEHRYRTLVENFPNGSVGLFDEDLRYTAVGGELLDTLEVAPEDRVGERLADLHPSALFAEVEPHFRAALDGETSAFDIEYRDRRLSAQTVPVRNADGDVTAGMLVIQDVTERWKAQRDLRESEAKLRMLAENLDEIVWMATPDADEFLYINPAFEDIWGVHRDEVYDETLAFLDYVHPDDRDRVRDAFTALPEEALVEEYRIVRPDGEVRWIRGEGRKVSAADEGVDRVVGTAEDITERKRAEQALQTSEERYRALVDASSDVVYRVSSKWSEMHELEGKEFLADTDEPTEEWVEKYIHPDDRSRVMQAIDEAIRTKSMFELEHRVERDDGNTGWTYSRAVPMLDDDGEIEEWIGMASDITDRKQHERELAASEHRYRALAENFPNGGVGLYDEDLRYTLVTGTMWDDIDPDAADFEGKTIWECLPPDTADDLEPVFRAALDGESGSVVSTLGGRTYRVWATPLRDAGGEITGGQSFALDITDRLERERELEATVAQLEESNDRLESFASMLAHELRNPVTIGQIYGGQLPAEQAPEAVEYVREAFDRIEDMIDVLLVLTRGRDAVEGASEIDLAVAAREAWADSATRQASVDVAVDAEIQADKTYIRHLFRNLFENSVQHGGSDVAVRVGDLLDGDGFYVADDGSGIPADDCDAVFEAGYTTASEEGGTGLGLAFVAELADVYEWEVAVTESAAGGARFEFTNITEKKL